MQVIELDKRRKPKQERSKKKYNAIIDTTARIVSEEGFKGLTTNRIAQESNVGIATLYGYFNDKEDIVSALLEREMLGLLDMIEGQTAQLLATPSEKAFESLCRQVLEYLRSIAPLVRAYSGYISPNSDNPITKEFFNQVELIFRMLVSKLTGKSPADVKIDAYIATRALAGVAVAVASEEPPRITIDEAVDRAGRLLMILLGSELGTHNA